MPDTHHDDALDLDQNPEHEHEHEHGPLAELVTVRDWLRYAVTRFNRAGVFCGHGVHDTYDEAVWLILGTLALPLDRLEPFLDAAFPARNASGCWKPSSSVPTSACRRPTSWVKPGWATSASRSTNA